MAGNIPLSELVRLHRKAAGLSRNDLAVLAGVGKTVLYDLEHGKTTVRLDTLLKILRTLNITVHYDSHLLREMSRA
ncbi:transcriptional regulator [bacterium CPR1]|nr:transcriptional regulator [bacterium CPR1]